ncbi:MAG: hypothetical protein AB1629_05350 [Candidatus Omnitrophota bacterium]
MANKATKAIRENGYQGKIWLSYLPFKSSVILMPFIALNDLHALIDLEASKFIRVLSNNKYSIILFIKEAKT